MLVNKVINKYYSCTFQKNNIKIKDKSLLLIIHLHPRISFNKKKEILLERKFYPLQAHLFF
jgi:hypothetical protein